MFVKLEDFFYNKAHFCIITDVVIVDFPCPYGFVAGAGL